MNLYKHVVEQPFVMATGVAALVHSTWSLGTLFSGKQPEAALTVEFIGWIVPAFLIAFAMDVGQIVTSAEIRAGNRSKAKYATFAVFAISTFYLQWLYMAHHMPQLALAGGVREQWSDFATFVRDAAVWIIPAFLPLSTLMYTFSSDHAQPESKIKPVPSDGIIHIELPKTDVEALPAPMPTEGAELAEMLPETAHRCTCEYCGKSFATQNGLKVHQSRHCEKNPTRGYDTYAEAFLEGYKSVNGNGHGSDEQ